MTARISRTESPVCTPGNSANNLTTADPEIWGIVEVANAAVGDVGRFEWINPAGQTVLIVNFQAITAEGGPGTYCLNGHLTRPGDPTPLTAGTWTLRVVWTGQIPFTTSINFAIASAGGGTTPSSLVATWTWTAACNSGNLNGQFRVETQQANGSFQGIFLNTNASDIGTLSGTVQGSTVQFTRSLGLGNSQQWTGTVTSNASGLTITGNITASGLTCTWTATTAASTTPPPTGGGTGTATSIVLRGGSFSNGAFSSNGQIWDTIPNGAWVLGVTNASAGAFLNDPSNGTVNIPAGTYITFSQPAGGNLGSAIEFRVTWSTGQEEAAVFQVGSQTSPAEWTRLLGSTNITVAGAAIGQVDRVRAGDGGSGLVASAPTDNTIRLTIFAPGGSTTPPPSGGTGVNLLQNGNADAGPATAGCSGSPSIPGWATGGSVAVCAYGTPGGYPTAADPGAPDRGNNFFGGGFDTSSIMTQVVSIATLAAQADAGTLPYTLSGYLGGFGDQNDNVSVRADFFDGSASLIGTALLPAVLAAERNNGTRMNLKTATGMVPRNTRSIRVVVEFTRISGSSNDGYADSLSLIVGTAGGTTPPPTTPPPTPPPTCNYALVPASANVFASGSVGLFFRVDTATGCTWTATTSTSWITLDPPTSRTGSGALVYNVAANTATAPRTGTIAVSGRTFTVTQAAAPVTPPPAAGPLVSEGGAVNAASGVPASLPGGAIALASYFSAYGTFGNIQPVQVSSFPLPTTLGGVRIIIRQGARQVNAIMYFASSTQLNAIMPSDAPLGDVELIVEVNGQQGPPTRIRTVPNNFGIFSVAAGQGPGIIQNFNSDVDQPLNTRSRTAKLRQIAIAWGTGSGAIAGVPDNNPPRPLANGTFPQTTADAEVLVGGQSAEIIFKGRAPCCAGVDVFYFIVPDNAPTGCSVPVQIRVGANWSNAVTMAIEPNGQVCQDAVNPFSQSISAGGKVGTILLSRISALAQIEGLGPLNLTVDVGAAVFNQFTAAGDLGYSALGALPPLGACQTMAVGADLEALLGDLGGALGGVGQGSTLLHAGNELTFVAPSGARVPMPLIDPNSTSPLYAALLGGGIPLVTTTTTPLVLNSGRVTVTGPGGRQVGAFSASADLLTQPTWSNRDQMTTINRATGVTFQWNGGDSTRQAAILFGASFDQARKAGAGFLCAANIGTGSVRVQPAVMSNMPTVAAGISETSGAVLMFAVVPIGTLPSFNATGIDRGMLLNGSINLRTVAVQ